MQNPNFHGKNTDEVMGFCRQSVLDLFAHFVISFTLDMNLLSFWYVNIMSMINKIISGLFCVIDFVKQVRKKTR